MRKDFELSILFHTNLLKGDAPLRKKADGTYQSSHTETLFQGYALGKESAEGQLARFDTARSIADFHLREINEHLKNKVDADGVRAVLRVMGGSPIR
jgi:hypothetical protein